LEAGGMTGSHGAVVGASLALGAFAVAVLAGLAAGNPEGTVLLRALVAMVVCYPLGWMSGAAWRRTLAERAGQRGLEGLTPAPAEGRDGDARQDAGPQGRRQAA
jgi:hypothetical protein